MKCVIEIDRYLPNRYLVLRSSFPHENVEEISKNGAALIPNMTKYTDKLLKQMDIISNMSLV